MMQPCTGAPTNRKIRPDRNLSVRSSTLINVRVFKQGGLRHGPIVCGAQRHRIKSWGETEIRPRGRHPIDSNLAGTALRLARFHSS